jgi:Protein of unknown function (DUF3455)
MYNISRNVVLARSLALVSLLAVPSCVDTADELDTAESELLLSCACPANTPAVLAPPADQNLAFVLDATGVQQYACKATATGAAWALVAPVANLLKDGYVVGTHYAGPTWKSNDGSFVTGARAAGATVDATAIQWLLLSVTGHGGNWLGQMSNVTAIQRLETTAGLAPTTGCDVAQLGGTVDVPYTAKYFFYRTNSLLPVLNTRCGAN